MSLKTFLIVSAVLALGFGIVFLLLPLQMAALYGLEPGPEGAFIARHMAIDIAGYGLLAWLLRNDAKTETMRRVLLGFFIIDAVGFVLAITNQLSGGMNALGWSISSGSSQTDLSLKVHRGN